MTTITIYSRQACTVKPLYYACFRCHRPEVSEDGYCQQCKARPNHERDLQIVKRVLVDGRSVVDVAETFYMTPSNAYRTITNMTLGTYTDYRRGKEQDNA